MLRAFTILAAGLVVGSPALSQAGASLDGSWKGEYVTQSGSTARAELAIEGTTGTWRAFIPHAGTGPIKVNPCFERAHPLELAQQPAGGFKLAVHASKTMKGCQDFVLNLRQVDADHVEGRFGDGRELKLERK